MIMLRVATFGHQLCSSQWAPCWPPPATFDHHWPVTTNYFCCNGDDKDDYDYKDNGNDMTMTTLGYQLLLQPLDTSKSKYIFSIRIMFSRFFTLENMIPKLGLFRVFAVKVVKGYKAGCASLGEKTIQAKVLRRRANQASHGLGVTYFIARLQR